MKNYGRTSVSEFLADDIVYRKLEPLNPELPGLDDLRQSLGLAPGQIPRKSDPDYARVIVQMLKTAHARLNPRARLERLIFLGDTHLLDATAFDNLCQVGEWQGLAFIGAETAAPAEFSLQISPSGQTLFLANRWQMLEELDRACTLRDFIVDEACVVIVDLDKTAIAARGRNGHTIDAARVQAVQQTVASLLGGAFDQAAFQTAYQTLNQPQYHSFTADNQDYLAYICLVLGSGFYDLASLLQNLQAGQLTTFNQFIQQVESQVGRLTSGLADIHEEIYAYVQAGDPTPFKAFRRNEYLATIRRMGFLEDIAGVEILLADEIVITQEVRAQSLAWRQSGAVIFGLSDKPDEASRPTAEQAAQGFQPIHRTPTHSVGG
jgi:hypothetical protein